ncbi:hypothetical protein SCLCIDRAFT_1213927 [Scleroderma citrinum Foug A]|uniref:Uncharacterized protein n=1 Tax=Scleroderma citrinum Foug A TaxID=1036808 RepID=A0A0C3AFQ7_9AGAM|nr:hypothetical protein SCLCIDRAFT_1213927 [Scleroderma citrinum Foug A]
MNGDCEPHTIPPNNHWWTRYQNRSAYVLVRMIRTKAEALNGLESGVLPIIPLRQQLPITPAYAFTDYCAQAQRIDHCIVELATLPSGQLCLLMHMLHYLEVVAG